MARPEFRLLQPTASKVMRMLIVSSVIGTLTLLCLENLGGQENVKTGKGKAKSGQGAVREPELAADLDEAIQTLEQNDFRAFFERYAPVEVLRNLRRQGLVDRATASISSQPKIKQQLLSLMKSVRKQAPNVDTSRGLATIQLEEVGNDVERDAIELHLPDTGNLKLTGLGGDLKKVIGEASQLLVAGDVRTFVERLFPASELARLQETGAMEDLVQQFNVDFDAAKAAPAARLQNRGTANLLKAWQSDFVQLQALTPELSDNGQTAVFRIESQNKQPARVIKFQKSDSGWRLFDDLSRVSAELNRQSKLKPRSTVTTVQMELVGGNWRFIELPAAGK